jgi:hypothetical protein
MFENRKFACLQVVGILCLVLASFVFSRHRGTPLPGMIDADLKIQLHWLFLILGSDLQQRNLLRIFESHCRVKLRPLRAVDGHLPGVSQAAQN